MVKCRLYRSAILSNLAEQEEQFYESFAKEYLIYLGNPKPKKTHIKEMKSILFETEIKRTVSFDRRLTKQEKKCLFLASKGKTIKETAKILNLKYNTIVEYRNSTIKKLKAFNLPSAVALGIKYNLLPEF